jgi:hypothetical protein
MMRYPLAFALYLLLTVFCFAQSANSSGVFPNAQGQLPSMVGGVAPSTILVSNAAQTINSGSDTSCFSSTAVGPGATIPANGPYAGNTYRLICRGVYTTPALNTSTVTAKIKWGATTVATVTSAALTVSAANLPFTIDVICTIQTAGSSGTMSCGGSFQYAGALTGLATVFNALTIASAATINTTTSSKIDATLSISGTITTQTMSAVVGTIEVLY